MRTKDDGHINRGSLRNPLDFVLGSLQMAAKGLCFCAVDLVARSWLYHICANGCQLMQIVYRSKSSLFRHCVRTTVTSARVLDVLVHYGC